MAQTLSQYTLVPCRDLKERFLRKDFSKDVTLSKLLDHFYKKFIFWDFAKNRQKINQKLIKLKKKFFGDLPIYF
jgi:hypothetical protein